MKHRDRENRWSFVGGQTSPGVGKKRVSELKALYKSGRLKKMVEEFWKKRVGE